LARGPTERGDFQTPRVLAQDVTAWLQRRGVSPQTVVEPTCGRGTFLQAALERWPTLAIGLGVELSPAYVAEANRSVGAAPKIRVVEGNFFSFPWKEQLGELPQPMLVLGNPPWVTNSQLMAMGSTNLPVKKIQKGVSGLASKTGNSNFDICESMIATMLSWPELGSLAMLCKGQVARRVLAQVFSSEKNRARAPSCAFVHIDARQHFGASVDAGLLWIDRLSIAGKPLQCDVFADLQAEQPQSVLRFDGKALVKSLARKRPTRPTASDTLRWRSGIKHDCARIMELSLQKGVLRNGEGAAVQIESERLYPLLKSSDLSGTPGKERPRRFMVVPQTRVGEDTAPLAQTAPATWQYLNEHGARLDARKSAIYRNQTRFAIFGVGPYTFTPWKVAISGLYKQSRFSLVGPIEGKPVVFDDTCVFLGFDTQEAAERMAERLNAGPAQRALHARVFWDSKRPITAAVLQALLSDLSL
jgi:hypothetical protein